MPSYQEQIAQWRQQRQQQEANERIQEIQREYRQAQYERDQAISQNDMVEAEYHDQCCQNLEQEYARYAPPQQPQVPRGLMNWANLNPRFFERHGAQAVNAIDKTLGYMMRPRNSKTNRPDSTGMGMTRDQIFAKDGLFTKNGQEVLETLLQMHGPEHLNVSFDPQETGLSWQEAAKDSGLSQKDYLNCYNTLKRQGRIS